MENGFEGLGGYMQAKITKLEEQFSAASNPYRQTNLFDGISIFVNGRTNPSADELKRIMMTHGGIYHHYERSHTTYIIAENLPDVKIRQMENAKKKIISAKWIVDCLNEKRILDYAPYLLYTNQKVTQPKLNYNTITKPNEKSSANTANDENFLQDFYQNSRLHHIATLGAGFKQYISELRDKGITPAMQIARNKLEEELKANKSIGVFMPTNDAYIMHIDMDCFFVSVALRQHAHLRGQPIAVTHSRGGAITMNAEKIANRKAESDLWAKRLQHKKPAVEKVLGGFVTNYSLSEIASCSYEARERGIRNGMFVGEALKLCPELQTVPYDFESYKEVAQQLYDTLTQYTLNIEAVSCDEMFVDLTELLQQLQVPVMNLVNVIRKNVYDITGCTCSAGIGPNKLLARLATQRAKPNGQYEYTMDNAAITLGQLPITNLPGVGSSTAYALKKVDLETCHDLQGISLVELQKIVGKKTGETLYQFCRGIDKRSLNYHHVRKSVSAEVNYGIRFTKDEEVIAFLQRLSNEVHIRLMEIKKKTKCVNLKVMTRAKDAPEQTAKFMGHGVCDSISKAITLTEYTNNLDIICNTVLTIMKQLNLPPNELRGIGIQLTKLQETKQQLENTNTIKALFQKAITNNNNNNKSIDKNEIYVKKSKNNKNNQLNILQSLQAAKNTTTTTTTTTHKTINNQKTSTNIRNFLIKKTDNIIRKSTTETITKSNNLTKNLNKLVNEFDKNKVHNVKCDTNTSTDTISDNNIFKENDFQTSILCWISANELEGPQDSDIQFIINHAKEYIWKRNYHFIYTQLMWLCRVLDGKMGANACTWHKISNDIISAVQNEMAIINNGQLFYIKRRYNCTICNF